jgi:hypothetical protein
MPARRKPSTPAKRGQPADRRGKAVAPKRSHVETTMSDKKNAAPPDAGADRNVDQIRDILFGGQMRDYERRFQDLNERIEADFKALRLDLDKRVTAIDKRLDEALDKLAKGLRQEVADRNKSVEDLESRLLQSARTQRGELTNAIESVGHELATTDERLRRAIAELEAALGEETARANTALTRSQDAVRAEKVGREDLAALLTEVALRLKGDFDLPGGN